MDANLPTAFEHERVGAEDNSGVIVLRSNVSSASEWRSWLDTFQSESHQCFIVKSTRYDPVRYAFRQDLVCQHNKLNKSQSARSRSTNCQAAIGVKIKHANKNTRRNDEYLRHDPPLTAIITLSLEHNHQIQSADALRQLRVSEETRKMFDNYFDDGLSPAAAMSLHESKLMCQDNGIEVLANAAINPVARTVYHLHSIWRKANFGLVSNPFEKLKEKLEYYSSIGTSIEIQTDSPWCVLVVSAVMKRAQSLSVADEIVFIDSSSSCDSSQSTVTTVLVASKAGAIPIAILIHEGQSAESYAVAFGLLRQHYPHCFNGREAPLAVMTDDSAAMKSALRSVWPATRQLLCHFHVGQAEWRWLTQKVNNVPNTERQLLMKKFQKMMYATSEVDFEAAKQEFFEEQDDVDSDDDDFMDPSHRFRQRITKFLERGDEWLTVRRLNTLTRGSNTNNYSEATMRILKDIILNRTKAFNVVALVDFCSTVMESYIINRIMKFAHGRRADPRLHYAHLCQKMRDVDVSSVTAVDDFRYLVPSQSTANMVYTVDAEFGLCACPSGVNGAFCKHQAFVHDKFKVPFPNSPAVTLDERFALARLALGDKCPDKEFFRELRDVTCTAVTVPAAAPHLAVNDLTAPTAPCDFQPAGTDDAVPSLLHKLQMETVRLSSLVTAHTSTALMALLPCLQAIKTEEDMIRMAYQCRLASRTRKGGVIKVQPTSIARRRPGLTRGSKRVAAGRPASEVAVRRSLKRARLLAGNIANNVPHAKSHGIGH